MGVKDPWLTHRADPARVRLTVAPGPVGLWGDMLITLDGLTLVPNRFSLGSPPIELSWTDVRVAEVTETATRAGIKLTLVDLSAVWIETATSRVPEVRRALVASGVSSVPTESSDWQTEPIEGLPLLVAGAALGLVGVISVVAGIDAAHHGREFTASLGGLLFGLGIGLVLVGGFFYRRDRPLPLLSGLVILGATFVGYLLGGLIDNALV